MNSIEQVIATLAREQGFILIAFARIRRLTERGDFYAQWLAEDRHGEMAYLARDPERRLDPRCIDARLKSVISLAYPYAAPAAPNVEWRAAMRGRIAAYALGPDYHDVVLSRARAIADGLAQIAPGSVTRSYVDTGAVFEREWAAEARLGWFGKNTMLLNKYHGSFFFLAEILTDIELDAPDEPYGEHCGTCRRCLDLCPTSALKEGYLIEPRLCISYLTIEHRGAIPAEMRERIGNWVFGCDVCQEVCPWNRDGGAPPDDELAPYLPALMELDEERFRLRFGKSAIRRTKRRGLLRNAAVVLGNTGNPDAVPVLASAMAGEPEAMVRAHAAWALGRLGGGAARRSLERSRQNDPDAGARAEIESALASMR